MGNFYQLSKGYFYEGFTFAPSGKQGATMDLPVYRNLFRTLFVILIILTNY